MKKISLTCLVIVLTGVLIPNSVSARGSGGHGGGGFGGGHFGGGHFGPGADLGHGGYRYGRGVYGLGIGLGVGYGLGYYGGYPYYGGYGYPPTVVQVSTTPPIFIQQTPVVVQQHPPGYWYYCSNPEGYYPYIKQCPSGWQQVAPSPSDHP